MSTENPGPKTTKADELAIRLLMLNTGVDRESATVMWFGSDLLAAAKSALHEMVHTTAPRHSFTDAVDALDEAIAKAEGR